MQGKRVAMTPEAPPPLNLVSFLQSLGRTLAMLIRERAHAQIVITIHQGHVPLVEVNRKYKPQDLPQV